MDSLTVHRGGTAATAQLDEALEVARLLAETGAIGGLHIRVVERPTFEELARYRTAAARYGLALRLTGDAIDLLPLSDTDSVLTFHQLVHRYRPLARVTEALRNFHIRSRHSFKFRTAHTDDASSAAAG